MSIESIRKQIIEVCKTTQCNLYESLMLEIGKSDLSKILDTAALNQYEFYNEIVNKITLNHKIIQDDQQERTDDSHLENMKKYLDDSLILRSVINQCIWMLQKALDKKKSEYTVSETAVNRINDLVAKLHDLYLNVRSGVTCLWCDGEIDFTKGGDLYGCRRRFQSAPPLQIQKNIFTFPKKDGDLSFAFLTHENAMMIRDQMLKSIAGASN